MSVSSKKMIQCFEECLYCTSLFEIDIQNCSNEIYNRSCIQQALILTENESGIPIAKLSEFLHHALDQAYEMGTSDVGTDLVKTGGDTMYNSGLVLSCSNQNRAGF